jgi:hypothetical protein
VEKELKHKQLHKQKQNQHDLMLAEFEQMYLKDPSSLVKYKKGYAILRLVRMVPDFTKFFSQKTLLPVVMMSFELKGILDVNIEEGIMEIEYGLCLDWFDVLTKEEYAKTREKDYYPKIYPFQPKCVMTNVKETDFEESSSKGGTRFNARYKLGKIDGIDDEFTLVHLKRTLRAKAKIKQDFNITAYPVDKQAVVFGFEMKTLNADKIVNEINSRIPKSRKFGTSNTKVYVEFNDLPMRVKDTGSDSLECKNSGFSYHWIKYPLMLPKVTTYKEFILDTNFQRHLSKSKYVVETCMYRDSHTFFAKNILPVLLIVGMTFFINFVDPADVADRLSILMTLFLTLYAHKYVVLDKVETSEMTTIELVIIIGYVCMFMQGALIAFNESLTERGFGAVGYYGNFFIGFFILFICGAYAIVLRDHAKIASHIKRNNNVIVPKELMHFCTKKTKIVLRESNHYQASIKKVNKQEKKITEAILETVIGIPSDILAPKNEWPVAMYEDAKGKSEVRDWLQKKNGSIGN